MDNTDTFNLSNLSSVPSLLPYNYYIQYGCALYEGKIVIKQDVLFIYVDNDEFKIHLRDIRRDNKITLYHRNRQNNLDGNRYWHIQRKDDRLPFLLFLAFTHSIYKEIGNLPYTTEDFHKFLFDANKYKEINY